MFEVLLLDSSGFLSCSPLLDRVWCTITSQPSRVTSHKSKEVKKSFKTALKKAGIKDFLFHDLRHTFASRLVMRGAPLKAVQELLGHKDIKMTMRYAHLADDFKKDAVKLLDGIPEDLNEKSEYKKRENR